MKALCFFIGINIMALAVALSKLSILGTSPIAAIPNVLSESFSRSIGETTIFFMVFLVVLQLLIQLPRKAKDLFLLLSQLIPGVLFGSLINAYVSMLKPLIHWHSYALQLLTLLLSILILAIGVVIEVASDFIVMPGEGLPKTIAKTYQLAFPNVKLFCDTSMVLVALILSFAFGHPFLGIREGILLATFLTGPLVSLIVYSQNRITKK
ncbi:hypothetical protein EA456_01145 [Streptococcus dysgalactiae subsp. dysgalactiae]|uniref:DUF6198 family protein n=1 Tax=Streptococcus dysgalactiae TaxID=1334 RepID=UPI000651E122|nr:DUF6198 family protein [Streptococcus dysgalactiae]MBM6532951.1 hypothetical protein [Streptococcus dysgalactiae subsp. equisimilis]MBM6540114.1 hypothetical protein [Streptococcus dysgalactiae subsp. equisimilis]MBM6547567.1 hypothetical protein [Streptococcus dysgalactiae subsp. equisimilis]OCX05653.1 hypothetical protein BBG09_01995 [Streptococcus dysgalactiae subsp. equisimilis]QGH01010.1 hypothetical protein EA456_01145 [Streptococcus dysgalactiae subsp. dysgalactiae]